MSKEHEKIYTYEEFKEIVSKDKFASNLRFIKDGKLLGYDKACIIDIRENPEGIKSGDRLVYKRIIRRSRFVTTKEVEPEYIETVFYANYLDLDYPRTQDVKECENLWKYVFIEGVKGAMHKIKWKKNYGNKYYYWEYDKEDRTWLMSKNKGPNSAYELSKYCGIDIGKIRNKVNIEPDGYFKGERLSTNGVTI